MRTRLTAESVRRATAAEHVGAEAASQRLRAQGIGRLAAHAANFAAAQGPLRHRGELRQVEEAHLVPELDAELEKARRRASVISATASELLRLRRSR